MQGTAGCRGQKAAGDGGGTRILGPPWPPVCPAYALPWLCPPGAAPRREPKVTWPGCWAACCRAACWSRSLGAEPFSLHPLSGGIACFGFPPKAPQPSRDARWRGSAGTRLIPNSSPRILAQTRAPQPRRACGRPSQKRAKTILLWASGLPSDCAQLLLPHQRD